MQWWRWSLFQLLVNPASLSKCLSKRCRTTQASHRETQNNHKETQNDYVEMPESHKDILRSHKGMQNDYSGSTEWQEKEAKGETKQQLLLLLSLAILMWLLSNSTAVDTSVHSRDPLHCHRFQSRAVTLDFLSNLFALQGPVVNKRLRKWLTNYHITQQSLNYTITGCRNTLYWNWSRFGSLAKIMESSQ